MKSLTTLFVCCFVFISNAQISSTEKEALIDIFLSTNGAEWNNPWDLNQPETTWQGVEIKDNKVVAIELGFNNLQGQLPASIENLKHLETLSLFFNNISGSLPDEITNLKKLKKLDLTSNAFAGALPSELSNLNNLEELLISSNNFTGMLPSEIGTLSKLKTLIVFDNHFFGDLPYSLTQLSNLKELIIAENSFNLESMQLAVAVLHKKGTKIDFNELKHYNINTELATLVLDDEN